MATLRRQFVAQSGEVEITREQVHIGRKTSLQEYER